MTDKVRLRTAFAWDCPHCGTRNYGDGDPVEITQTDREMQPEAFEDAVTGDWLADPDDVICSNCGSEFETEQPEYVEVDDEDFDEDEEDED